MNSNENPPKVKEDTKQQDLVEDFEGVDVEMLIPTMNVTPKEIIPEEKECIVKDESLLSLYDELLDMSRKDRASIDETLANFIDMVLNDGDASSASKEAIVNLIKAKTDVVDKMAKIADLMTRVKLKEKDTYPRYLAAHQQNHVYLNGGNDKRELLKALNKKMQNKSEPKKD